MPTSVKTLTLMRHGKSDWGDPTLADRERPLNPRGQRDVPKMAGRLKTLELRPSLILASAARRTTETAKLMADAFSYPREFIHREDGLYLAGAHAIAECIGSQDPSFNVMIVCGHNPGITEIANTFAPGITGNMPTSAMLTVRAPADDWAVFVSSPVELVDYDYPKNSENKH